jgi:hypothetical protein
MQVQASHLRHCFLPHRRRLTTNAATHDEHRATEDSFYSAGLVAVMCKSFLCAFEYSAPETSGSGALPPRLQ